MEQCEDVLHHSRINLLCNTMRGNLHVAEATTHKPPVMQHGQSQPRLQLPCRPFAQHMLHDVDTGYATTTCEVVSAPGATMAGLHTSVCQLWCIIPGSSGGWTRTLLAD